MYPESKAASLLEQMETERAISDLVEIALELWLPLAESAVLSAAAPPPDPTGAADQDAQWNYLVDAVILYGIGIIAADAYRKAFEGLTGFPLVIGKAALHVAKPDLSGMPSRATLRDRAAAVLKRRLNIDVTATEQIEAANPEVRTFANNHIANVKNRIIDAVARVFKRVRKTNDDTPSPEVAREEVVDVFDPLDPQWSAAADEVGQTHATGTLNAALEAAAQATGRELELEWVAIHDTHTRLAHAEADGQRRSPGVPFDVGGEPLRFPGDPLGDPENVINCRCRLFAKFVRPNPDLVAAGTSPVSEKVASMTDYRSFTSVLAVIGTPTDDGRMFATDIKLAFRDFPLPLLWQEQSAGGHFNSFTVGVIESAGVVGTEVIGKGYLLNTPQADQAATQIEHGVTGPSVDLGDVEWELRDKNGAPISEQDYYDNPDIEMVQTVLSAKVLAATLVATPAFGETSITLGATVAKGEDALVAAAALAQPGLIDAPVYPSAFFADPKFTAPTLPHITPDGRIQGHLASFNVCHIGIQDSCVIAPRSATEYAWFHTAPPVKTDGGTPAKVGRLTVGGGHAGPKLGVGPTIAHYDNAGTCFALVHVGEDAHGIWFSGVAHPAATNDQIVAGLSAPLSGDWRNVGGNLELVAALAVNTPGFPIIASGATDDSDSPMALVASLGPCAGETAEEFKVSGLDGIELAKHIVAEWRASEKRQSEAAALIRAEGRRQAAAIIEGME